MFKIKNVGMKELSAFCVGVILGIWAIYSNSKTLIHGPIAAFLIIGISAIISEPLLGGLTGLFATSAGLYLKLNYYKLPEMKPKNLEKFIPEFNKFLNMLNNNYIIIILFGVIIGIVFGLIGKFIRKKKWGLDLSTSKIVYSSIFIAMSVAINTVRIGEVSFSGFPIIYSGYVLGPVMGFIVGSIADIVAFIIRPSSVGGFNPLFTITSGLTGFIPVITTKLLGDKYPKFKLWKVFIGIMIGQVVTSVVLAPIFQKFLYARPLIQTMTSAGIKQAFSIPVYAWLFVSTNEAISGSANSKKYVIKLYKE